MKTSHRMLIAGALALWLTWLPTASAQWNKKPYTEWSDKDAQKILSESPWARTQVFTDPVSIFRAMPNRGPVAESGTISLPNTTHVNFRIRFLSAKPIRQAISRRMELQQKGQLDEQLAAQLQAFASGEFFEYIVVTVTCDSQGPGVNFEEALSLLHRSGTAQLKNNTFLEVKGGRRLFLEEYQTPRADGLGARFIFPRLVDGEPFITVESREVRFFSELSETHRLDRRFKIKDMIYEGKLEY